MMEISITKTQHDLTSSLLALEALVLLDVVVGWGLTVLDSEGKLLFTLLQQK